jgi:hypothetical protein
MHYWHAVSGAVRLQKKMLLLQRLEAVSNQYIQTSSAVKADFMQPLHVLSAVAVCSWVRNNTFILKTNARL